MNWQGVATILYCCREQIPSIIQFFELNNWRRLFENLINHLMIMKVDYSNDASSYSVKPNSPLHSRVISQLGGAPLNPRKPRGTRFLKDKESKRDKAAKKQLKSVTRSLERDFKRLELEPHSLCEYQLEPQGLIEGIDFFFKHTNKVQAFAAGITYKGSLKSDLSGNVMARFEDICAFLVAVSEAQNIKSFVAVTHLYLRTFYTGSILVKATEFVNSWVSAILIDVEAGMIEYDFQSGFESDVDWFSSFLKNSRLFISNWQHHKQSQFFPMMGNLVSLVVSLGFMPELADSPVSLLGFDIFKIKVWDLQKDGLDFVEVVATTILFFLERGHAAFVARDPSLLLYNDNEAATLDAEYAILVSALPLLECGGLEELNNSKVPGIKSVPEYDERVSRLVERLLSMASIETNKIVKNTLSIKIVALTKVRTALVSALKSSSMREKPFAVLICGPSSVGKTSVNNYVLKTVLSANGFPSSKEHCVVLNDADKFQSELKSSHTGVTFDDYGNNKVEFYEKAPTMALIDFINNVPKAALKADLNSKGNVMIMPKVVTVTTNVKSLLAHHFSNEPASILRRFNAVLEVALRPTHVDSDGGPNADMMLKDPDAWAINVQVVRIVRGSANVADAFEFVNVLRGVGIADALKYLKGISLTHFNYQKQYVNAVETVFSSPVCPHCLPIALCSDCTFKPEEPPLYDTLLCEHNVYPGLCAVCSTIEPHMGDEELFNPLLSQDFDIHDPEVVRRLIEVHGKIGFSPLECILGATTSIVVDKTSSKCGSILDAFRCKWKASAILLVGATIVGALEIVRRSGRFRREFEAHGQLMPKPLPDDEPSIWTKCVPQPVPMSLSSRGITSERLVDLVNKSIAVAFVGEIVGSRNCCNIVPMCGNTWLAPGHMFVDGQIHKIEVRSCVPGETGKHFQQFIDESMWCRIPETDYIVLRLVSGGDVPNLLKFLYTDYLRMTAFCVRTSWRNQGGQTVGYKCRSGPIEDISLPGPFGQMNYKGYSYAYGAPTQKGLCMCTAVFDGPSPGIVGFHIAGVTGSTRGVLGAITQSQVSFAVSQLDINYGLQCHSSGTMPTSKYDIDYFPSCDIPGKHCVNFLSSEHSPNIVVMGSTPMGVARFQSGVKKSDISDSVEQRMGLPRCHGAPDMRQINKHWQRDLALMTVPCNLLDPVIFKRARDDYYAFIHSQISENMLDIIHPYADDALLAGADGVPGVDRMDLSTSMGFPINKPKRDYITESGRIVEGITAPLDMQPIYWDEVDRFEDVLAKGERIYTIFRGNLKDEPTKFGKDKIRVFAGCEVVFTILVRKYYLSIIRLMQRLNFRVESAVGVNAYGKQWTGLVNHLNKFEGDRYIAGDFKAFDKNISPLLTMSVFDLYIQIAKRASYTDRELTIMRGIATEIVYPTMEFSGVLLRLFGSNPSGHPLTVHLNNGANSIYERYAFYDVKPAGYAGTFNDRVVAVNYGDDNLMKVHPDEEDFSHTTMAHSLSKIGIVYTMADKGAESVPYIQLSQVDFLKRSFRFEPELNNWMAPLDEASISKSLHNRMYRKKSGVTSTEVAVQSILAAHNEYFRFGKEVFEKRREQLLLVISDCELSHIIPWLPTWVEMKHEYLEGRVKVDSLRADFVMLEPDIEIANDLGSR